MSNDDSLPRKDSRSRSFNEFSPNFVQIFFSRVIVNKVSEADLPASSIVNTYVLK